MEDQTSLETVERPNSATKAQDTWLPECYDDWDLPECHDHRDLPDSHEHWDLPEVYLPVVSDTQQSTITSSSTTLPTASDKSPALAKRSCWRRYWGFWLLFGLLLVGGAAGGGIAGALLSRTPQDLSTAVVTGPSTVSITLMETSFDTTSTQRGTELASESESAETMKTISGTRTDSTSVSAKTSSGMLPSTYQITNTPSGVPQLVGTRAITGEGSGVFEPGATATQNPTPFLGQDSGPGITSAGVPKTTAKPEASLSNVEPNPGIRLPSKPTRAIHIGKAAQAGQINELFEIAFFPENICDYTVIGKHGDWVCDTPFLMAESVYQWKGCGGDTWLVWGPTQNRFGGCVFSVTERTPCHGLEVFGVWLCRPE
ncbi:hypothetical protein QBC40DRAFT_303100 [Triangularia verruculosa]|uniref:Uncharacterized protein n=1 Tax=Triangularia verruculosa TaxID=2587418 RepID=A0AAN6XRB9_9PEZI|nr:hypothetical protein QBC40DRAFT_303100 [Triangularia verruculosa]